MARFVFIGAPEVDADAFQQRLRVDLPGINLFATNRRELALQELADCEVIIGHQFQFDDHLLELARKLRFIQSLTSGIDAIVDLPSLRPDVLIASTRGMHGPQMSELVFLQMLTLTRDYPRMLRNQVSCTWERWPQSLLAGKCAVIVGVGAISTCLAPRCKSFDMTVYGVTSSPRPVPGFDRMYSRESLPEAASLADYLILVVPHLQETANLVDDAVIRSMKRSAFLINVARGGVLDETALINALNEQRLAGAALDVFRQTPLPPESELWQQPRLLITPLVGGMSDVYLDQCYPYVLDNLRRYFSGHFDQLQNLITRTAVQ